MAVSRKLYQWLLFFIIGASLLFAVRAVGAQEKSDDDAPDMISIGATTFEMGEAADVMLAECNLFRSGCEVNWFGSSQPVHTVQVDPYSIDLYEVTNEAFLAFINELGSIEDACDGEICLTLDDSAIETGSNGVFTVDDDLLTHPVAGVSWYGANAYCEWRGDRLPTEAEWELAAGWDFESESKRFYPWGDEFDGTALNFCDENCAEQQANDKFDDGYETTAPIGSYEGGRSDAGLYDAGGNLWEWVSDWFAPTYYDSSPADNPLGPITGDNKVVRGGSWFDTGNFASTSIRFPAPPKESGDSIGFRCASDAVDEANMIGQEAATATPEPTREPTATAIVEPTAKPTEKPAATPTPKLTVAPTKKPTVTATKEPTAAATKEPTATATKEPTATATKEPTATATKEPTATATKEPTATATKEPTATATKEPTATATKEPAATATKEPAATASAEPTAAASSSTGSTSASPPYFYCDIYPGQDLGSTYIIGACEVLLGIAGKLDVSYQALLAANPQITNPNLIKMGDVLNVPGSEVSRPVPPPEEPAPETPAPAPVSVPTILPPVVAPPATPSGSSLR